MDIQNVKGGRDFLPKEQKIRNYINNTLIETFENYGYKPVETSILCYYEMLSGKYDDNNDILKEIYKLKDQGNRELGLRYDLTVPFAKLIALNKNQIRLPLKRYEINKVFRDGPVKVGRDREFTQCDCDVVGIKGQMIEAEMLKLYIDAFKKLNIDIIIKYNSRNLMSGLIKEAEIDDSLTSKVITVMDKMEKLSKEDFRQSLKNINLKDSQISQLLESFNTSINELTSKYKDTTNETLKQGIEETNNLSKYIKELNIEEYCKFTPTLARGQDYYTGNVFEVYEKNLKIKGSIGGGGRYDNMITDFIGDNNQYSAVGISFGLTSLYELLKNENIKDNSQIEIYIIPVNTNVESLKLADKLRQLDINVDLEMNNKKIKKALDYANKEGIPYVIILGEDEINNNKIVLKDMINKNNIEIDLNNIEKIKELI